MMPAAPDCEAFLAAMGGMKHLPSLFLQKLGRPLVPMRRPGHLALGEPKQCYKNAALLVLESEDLTYVEGYACPPGLIPVHHAWCLDAKGWVIDTTLTEPENTQYFGIPMSPGFLRRELERSDYWGLFAEITMPERYFACLADIQAGVWAVAPAVEAEIRSLLAPLAPAR